MEQQGRKDPSDRINVVHAEWEKIANLQDKIMDDVEGLWELIAGPGKRRGEEFWPLTPSPESLEARLRAAEEALEISRRRRAIQEGQARCNRMRDLQTEWQAEIDCGRASGVYPPSAEGADA